MAKKTQTTNKVLFDTIRNLKKASTKTGVNVYRAVAKRLEAPASQRAQVNLSKISKLTKDGDKVIVPGKILGDGSFDKKVTVVAFAASEQAVAKIEKAGGKFVKINDYLANKPDSKIRILG